ncbi:hypothetical protein EDD86DRAFT_250105 [Gorgonomyces haynaldii]|nr:hypothetical protein EDD86DRAFT_250105 [Gorgonomyces haynaldii]
MILAMAQCDILSVVFTALGAQDFRLPNRNLNGRLPAELGKLFALQKLDLSGNKLTGTIPSTLQVLSDLDLNGNPLTGPAPSLSGLSLSVCRLSGVCINAGTVMPASCGSPSVCLTAEPKPSVTPQSLPPTSPSVTIILPTGTRTVTVGTTLVPVKTAETGIPTLASLPESTPTLQPYAIALIVCISVILLLLMIAFAVMRRKQRIDRDLYYRNSLSTSKTPLSFDYPDKRPMSFDISESTVKAPSVARTDPTLLSSINYSFRFSDIQVPEFKHKK